MRTFHKSSINPGFVLLDASIAFGPLFVLSTARSFHILPAFAKFVVCSLLLGTNVIAESCHIMMCAFQAHQLKLEVNFMNVLFHTVMAE